LKDATTLGRLEKECDHLERCNNIRNQKRNITILKDVTTLETKKGILPS
jgi:hypothetical protein